MDMIDIIQARGANRKGTVLERGAYLQGDYVNLQNCIRILARAGRVTIPNNDTAYRNLRIRYGYFIYFYMCDGAIKGFLDRDGNIYLERA